MNFKVYNQDGSFLVVNSMRNLAELTGATKEQAQKIYYKGAGYINGFEVIKL